MLGVKPEYFFRHSEVELGSVDFRKHSTFGKRQQEAVKEQVREHLERYFAAEELFDIEAPGRSVARWLHSIPVGSPSDAERAAERLRQQWELGTNPISNMTETLEENDVKVVGLEAHEQQVKETFGESRRRVLLKEYLLAKEEWGISIQAVLRRLFDLEIVSQSYYQSTAKFFSIKGWRKNEPGELRSEASYRLRQMVYRALAEDLVTPSRAAELLNTSLHSIERVLANEDPEEGQDAWLIVSGSVKAFKLTDLLESARINTKM